MPTLTLSPEEYESMMQIRRDIEAENARLKTELIEERGKNGDARIAALATATHAAGRIIAFAVANLPPEAIRGWPADELTIFAKWFEELPRFTTEDDELRNEWRAFAEECRKLETRRAAASAQIPTSTPVGA